MTRFRSFTLAAALAGVFGLGWPLEGFAQCATCASLDCASQLQACQPEPSCSLFDSCWGSCADGACIETCAESHPSSETGASLACMTAACGAECGLPSATPPLLDPGFGQSGWVREAVGFGQSAGWGGTVQSDGKVVVVGSDYSCGSTGFKVQPMVVRHEFDGELDSDFGDGGIARFDLPGTENQLIAVVEAADQKIVIAGLHIDMSHDVLLVRLEPDGSLDTGFGSGGHVFFDAGGDEIALDLVAHPDGRISVVGGRESGLNEDVLVARFAADGGIDTSFGGGAGYVVTSINTGTDEAFAVALQEDGKLVVAGHTEVDAFVARYLDDGGLDPAFGSGGFSVTHFGGDDWLLGVALQPDGKIVVAGTVFPSTGDAEAVVARYLANGAPDGSFGSSGGATFSFGSGDRALDVAIQSDERIVVADAVGLSGYEQISAFRLESDGTLDSGYGSAGIALPMNDALTSTPASLGLLPTGGVALMGAITHASYSSSFVAVAIDEAGAAEPGYGDAGVAVTIFREGTWDYGMDVEVAPDGRLLTAVTMLTPPQCFAHQPGDMAVTSHLPDGSLDPDFGTGGIADLTDIAAPSQVEAMALQPDGKILLAGNGHNADLDFRVVRLLPNGGLDPDFGTGGRVSVPIGSGDDYAMDIALQPDDKIVVVGTATGTTHDDIALVRLEEDGSLDSGFGSGGVVQTDVGSGTHDSAADVALQSDAKIVVAGTSATSFALLRYTSSGSLDTSFGSGGVVTRSVGAVSDSLGAVMVDIDGNVIAVGTADDGGLFGRRGAVLRHLADGSPDPTFGASGLLSPDGWAGLIFRDAVELPSHQIAIAGSSEINPDLVLVSVLHHGVPNHAYAPDGVARFDLGATDFAEAIALSTEERVALAGRIEEGGEIDLVVAQAPYPVPEPHGLAMIAAGVAGLAVLSRRR